MKKILNSEISLLHLNTIKETTNDERAFEYDINKKRTKAKLLKGAKRTKNLEVEVKSGCLNLRFNDGSFHEVIMPLLNDWHEKVNSIIRIKDHDVLIVDIEKGLDKSEKHIDTKVTIKFSDNRYVLHAYNTTRAFF